MKKTGLTPGQVLVPVGIGLTFSLFGDATLYTVLPDAGIAAQAGVSLGMVGVLLGLNRLARVVFNGPAGILYDRFPRRKLMIAAIWIGVLSTVFYALGYGPVPMIMGRVLWGLGWSGIWIGSNSMALDISSPQNRGKVNGLMQMWFFFGLALSAFSGGLFTDLFGYRGGLWVSAGLMSLAAVMWMFCLPETRPEQSERAVQAEKTGITITFPWSQVMGVSVPIFVIRLVFAGVIMSTTILWLSQFFAEKVRVNGWLIPLATLTGIFAAARVLVSFFSAPLCGWLSDRLNKRWLVVFFSLVLGISGLYFLSLPVLWLSVLGMVLSAICGGGIQAMVPALIGDLVDDKQQSRALGVVYTIGDLGSAIGPAAGLALIPLIGLGPVYRICAVIYVLTGVFSAVQVLIENQSKLVQFPVSK